jgi:SpoVK/Ycf46/Vps4 family AAA+-type ATPase
VFDYARTTPCVLFFDEFDAVGKERGDEHETGEIKRVVTSLLMQMDDLPTYTIAVAATNHSELLDRAVWRRFQLRLSLDAPTRTELTDYFRRFADSMKEPIGRTPSTLAKALGSISYAEAEEFCRDVRRRQVLAMGEVPLKKIVEERLKLWAARTSHTAQENASHDRLPSSAGPETGA